MKDYIKYVIYHGFCILDATINFVCALFNYHPGIDLSMNYLIGRETLRIKSEEWYNKEQKKLMELEAENKKAQAYNE
jgi:uncharacterized protein (DUF2132 family)